MQIINLNIVIWMAFNHPFSTDYHDFSTLLCFTLVYYRKAAAAFVYYPIYLQSDLRALGVFILHYITISVKLLPLAASKSR